MAAQQFFRGTPFTRTTILMYFFLTPWLIFLIGTALADELLGRYGFAVAGAAFLLATLWISRRARQTVTIASDRIVWRGRTSRYTIRMAHVIDAKLIDRSGFIWYSVPTRTGGVHRVGESLSNGDPSLELRLYGDRNECCKIDLTWFSRTTRLKMVRAIIHSLPAAKLHYTGPGDAWASEFDEIFPMRTIDGRAERLMLREIQNGLLMPA